MAPRLGRLAGDEKARLRERDQNTHYKAWYKKQRWRNLRLEVLLRDAYTCQHTGIICMGTYPAPNSAVVDHKIPHRGDEQLFWDINNLQTVSKAYHDSEKQKQERSQPGW